MVKLYLLYKIHFIFKLTYNRKFFFQKDLKKRVTHLYFTKNIYEAKLKANSEVLIIDCIYKSDKYCLPLLNVVETTYLNITFYAVFGFLLKQWIEDFILFLRILWILYKSLDLEDPKVIVTDRDTILMAVYSPIQQIYFIYSKFYLWHINKYV